MKNNYFLKWIKTAFVLLTMLLLSTYGARAQTAILPEAGYTNAWRYSYTGSDQTFTVPAGVTSIKVKVWGAGGGVECCGNGNTASPGGATMTGNGATATFTGLAAGTSYTFTVTSSAGCTSPSSLPAVMPTLGACPQPFACDGTLYLMQIDQSVVPAETVLYTIDTSVYPITYVEIPGSRKSITSSKQGFNYNDQKRYCKKIIFS